MLIFPTYQTLLAKTAATSSGGGIITSNLVLHLDAGDNSSYAGSGDTWYDLTSGNHDVTLLNSPTYSSTSGDGSFEFSGGSDHGTIPDDTDFLMGTGSFTEEAWHKHDGTTGFQGSMTRGQFSSLSWGGLWILGGYFYPYHISESGSALYENTGESVGTDWVHHVVTTENTGSSVIVKVYKNNSLVTTKTHNSSSWQPKHTSVGTSTKLYIANAYDGEIAIVRLYKGKALTSSEVTTNWNVDKTRFGH